MIDWFPTETDRAPGVVADAFFRWGALVEVLQLARSVDRQSPETVGHSERVADAVVALAGRRGWPGPQIAKLREAALVHDVGKVAVPEETLNAVGPLDPGQMATIRAHAQVGAQIVDAALEPDQVAWVRHHHERFDGRGYPEGLSGTSIPEGARLLALADAWDAMTHRSSSGPLGVEAAIDECVRESRHQFCPSAVSALLDVRALLPTPRPPAVVTPLRLVPQLTSSAVF